MSFVNILLIIYSGLWRTHEITGGCASFSFIAAVYLAPTPQFVRRFHPYARKSASKAVLCIVFMRLAQHLAALRGWCKQCLPGLLKPDVLRPAIINRVHTTTTMHDYEYTSLTPRSF